MIKAAIRRILGIEAEPLQDVAAKYAWAVPVVAALSLLSTVLESLSVALLVPLLGSLSGQTATPRFLSPFGFIFEWAASQGALAHAVLGQQGLITEAGYKEQAQSYEIMRGAANDAGNAENNAATGAEITGSVKAIAGLATLFTGLPISAAVAPVTGGAANAVGDPNGIGGLY